MTAYCVICPYCGELTTVPGNTTGKITFLWICPICDCRFETVQKALTDEQAIYTTKMLKEGVLNKRKP